MDTCLFCLKPILPPKRKFCSQKCSDKFIEANRQRKCKFCKKEFIGKRSQFCSVECKENNKANHITYSLICLNCKQEFIGKTKSTKFCSRHCYACYRVATAQIYLKACEICCTMFETKNPKTRLCSQQCSNEWHRQEAIKRNYYSIPRHIFPDKEARRFWLRRKRIRDNWVEDVKIEVLYERDKGICQLCGELVPWGIYYNEPLAPTKDHIISVSNGGEHSYANCQLAHRACNTAKNNREVKRNGKTQQKRESITSAFSNESRN